MIECLNPYGKGYMVMGKGPLFRRKEREERKLLIENNWVDAVITLPSKLMKFCPIPLVLLVINKDKHTNDVLFINASEFQKESGNRSTIDNIDKLAQEFKSRPLYSPISFTVSNQDIAENNYSINNLNYLTNEETQQYNLHDLSVTRRNLLKKLDERHNKIEKLLDDE
jgi:type I restriction enzyme M protein